MTASRQSVQPADRPVVRPIVSRPAADAGQLEALGDIDPLYARLFAARGVTDAEQLDYALARLAPVGMLDNVDASVALLLD